MDPVDYHFLYHYTWFCNVFLSFSFFHSFVASFIHSFNLSFFLSFFLSLYFVSFLIVVCLSVCLYVLLSFLRSFVLVFTLLVSDSYTRRCTRSCLILLPLLGITWMFGLLSLAGLGFQFDYVFTALNSVQVSGYISSILVPDWSCYFSQTLRTGWASQTTFQWKLVKCI